MLKAFCCCIKTVNKKDFKQNEIKSNINAMAYIRKESSKEFVSRKHQKNIRRDQRTERGSRKGENKDF